MSEEVSERMIFELLLYGLETHGCHLNVKYRADKFTVELQGPVIHIDANNLKSPMIIVTVLCITWLIRLAFRFWIDVVVPASISPFFG